MESSTAVMDPGTLLDPNQNELISSLYKKYFEAPAARSSSSNLWPSALPSPPHQPGIDPLLPALNHVPPADAYGILTGLSTPPPLSWSNGNSAPAAAVVSAVPSAAAATASAVAQQNFLNAQYQYLMALANSYKISAVAACQMGLGGNISPPPQQLLSAAPAPTSLKDANLDCNNNPIPNPTSSSTPEAAAAAFASTPGAFDLGIKHEPQPQQQTLSPVDANKSLVDFLEAQTAAAVSDPLGTAAAAASALGMGYKPSSYLNDLLALQQYQAQQQSFDLAASTAGSVAISTMASSAPPAMTSVAAPSLISPSPSEKLRSYSAPLPLESMASSLGGLGSSLSGAASSNTIPSAGGSAPTNATAAANTLLQLFGTGTTASGSSASVQQQQQLSSADQQLQQQQQQSITAQLFQLAQQQQQQQQQSISSQLQAGHSNHQLLHQPSAIVATPVATQPVIENKSESALKNLFTVKDHDQASVDLVAKMYRNGANYFDASCTWSGTIPSRNTINPVYSEKVFIGGVPWDLKEDELTQIFRQVAHPVHVESPRTRRDYGWGAKGSGYIYLIFENDKGVRSLIQRCTQSDHSPNRADNEFYFNLPTNRLRKKEVQVIPWVVSDSQFIRQPQCRVDSSRTVFIGALHGMITAELLATIMNDLFGNVVSAHIDTDKYKYPIGSGRVVFSSQKSYYKAVAAAFVEVKAQKFQKKIQIDPFLESSKCGICCNEDGPYFCRDCFKYFCRSCFHARHVSEGGLRNHRPVTRSTRNLTNSMPLSAPTTLVPDAPWLLDPLFIQQHSATQHPYSQQYQQQQQQQLYSSLGLGGGAAPGGMGTYQLSSSY